MDVSFNIISNYSLGELITYLRFSAGLSDSNFGGIAGGVVGGKDNLQLQQIPDEYARFLFFLKTLNANSYLELGIGQGGSFLLNSMFQPLLKICHAVDSCEYQKQGIQKFSDQLISINSKIEYLKKIKNIAEIIYFNSMTDEFFAHSNNVKYDIIFIDADHTYEGVKKDYTNSLKLLNPNGYIIFHDIVNTSCGVKQLWEELNEDKKIKEFVLSTICGIGVYKP